MYVCVSLNVVPSPAQVRWRRRAPKEAVLGDEVLPGDRRLRAAPGRRRKQTPAGKRYARKMLAKRFHRTKRSKEGQGEVALSPIDGRQVIPTPFSVRTVGGSLPTMNVPRNNTGTRCIAAPSGISTVAMGMRRLVAHGRKLTWLRGRRRWS